MKQNRIINGKTSLELFNKIIDFSVESFIDDEYYLILSPDRELRKKKLEQIFQRALHISFKYGTVYVNLNEQGEIAGCLSVLRWNELHQNKFDYDIIFNPPEYGQGSNDCIEDYINCSMQGHNILYILYVAVRKDQRRKGVATGLTRQAEELLVENTVVVSDIFCTEDKKESRKLSDALGADRCDIGKLSIVYKYF